MVAPIGTEVVRIEPGHPTQVVARSGHAQWFASLSVSPDGARLAVPIRDASASCWYLPLSGP
jgi:hypothetical protein